MRAHMQLGPGGTELAAGKRGAGEVTARGARAR
jgi:hypothetical protein